MLLLRSIFSKIFNIKLLRSILYLITGILFITFIYIAIIYFSEFESINYANKIDSIEGLFRSLTVPFTIGAAMLALLTLAITTSRTIRMDKQLELMGEQLKGTDEQLLVSQKQLELIEKQREASYQPDLIIKPKMLFVKSERLHVNKFILSVSNKINKIEGPFCNLINIGRGVAKSVRYKFSYDLDSCIRIINELDSDNLININNDKLSISIKSDKLNLQDYVHISDHNLDERSFDYILTLDLIDHWDDLRIPANYVLLNFLKDALSISKKQPTDPSIKTSIDDRFPALIAYCIYKDLGLKEHKKKFSIKFMASTFTQPYNSQYQMQIYNYKYDFVIKETE